MTALLSVDSNEKTEFLSSDIATKKKDCTDLSANRYIGMCVLKENCGNCE